MIPLLLELASFGLLGAAAMNFAMLVEGCSELRRLARRSSRDESAVLLKSAQMPVVSVVAVARDASVEARVFVRRLLDLHFSNHEVVLVLDGLSESGMDTWSTEFRLNSTSRGTWESMDPLRLVAIRQEGAGLAAALNQGVARAKGSVIALFDPESEFIPEALLRLIPPMLRDPETVQAVCGIAPEIATGTWIERFAALEALRLWLGRCAAFASWNMLVPAPGSTMLVQKDAIERAGGFTAGPLELILHLHGQARCGGPKFRMELVADGVSHAPVAHSAEELRRSTVRDQHALRAALAHESSIAGGIGAIGWGISGLVWDRLLRPLVETLLYVATVVCVAAGWAPLGAAALVVLCTAGSGIVVSMAAVVWRELAATRGGDPKQLTRLFFAAIPENLGYRQLRNLWLVAGFLK